MRLWKLGLMGFIGFAGLTAGCSDEGGASTLPDGGSKDGPELPPEIPGLVEIRIDPADQAVEVNGVDLQRLQYKAIGKFEDGREEDITSRVAFSHEPVIGTFQGPELQLPSDRGGQSKVTVSGRGSSAIIQGTATISVSVRRLFNDPASTEVSGDPAVVAQKFTGANDPNRAPELVYPNSGVLLPPNLNRLEFHFLPKPGTTLYQLNVSNGITDVKVHLNCYRPAGVAEGCIYEANASVWRSMADTNRGGQPVTVTLKATDAAGATVGTSAPLTLSFGKDNLEGGLYYWTTTTKSIMRFDFASTTQTQPELFVNASVTGSGGVNCIGCHALSRDGTKMVVEAQGSTDGRIAIVDVARAALVEGSVFPAASKSFFASWNPDSTRFVGVNDRGDGNNSGPTPNYNLRIQDGTTGAIIETIPNTGDATDSANHPDWSVDGQKIAYAQVQRTGVRSVSLQWPIRGRIALVTNTGSGWSAPTIIAPRLPLGNRYYPAIAPNSSFLVFNESLCDDDPDANNDTECDGDTDPSAKLYAAALTANAALVPLTNANAPGKRDANGNLANSFPKWNPFTFQRENGNAASKVNWVTFSSTRKYGLRNPPGGNGTLVWMTAVDPDKVPAGQDPSYPAFVLPFQNLSTSNHIAQWTEKVVQRIK